MTMRLITRPIRPLTEMAVKAIDASGQGVSRSMGFAAHPQTGARELARGGLRVAADVAALALMENDSPTRLKGRPVGRKIVAWGEPLPLDDVKAVGKALNASVNDVLLSCVAGAIGDYLRGRGDDPAGKEHPRDGAGEPASAGRGLTAGQPFGLAPLVLPIGIDNPVERVYAVRARMGELKGSYQPVLAYGVLAVAGLLNKAGAGRAARLLCQEGHRGDDQRARPGEAAQVLRLDAAAEHLLGAAVGRRRPWASASFRMPAACSSA